MFFLLQPLVLYASLSGCKLFFFRGRGIFHFKKENPEKTYKLQKWGIFDSYFIDYQYCKYLLKIYKNDFRIYKESADLQK